MSSIGEGEPDEIAIRILRLLSDGAPILNQRIADSCTGGDRRISAYRLSIMVKMGLVESRSARTMGNDGPEEDFGITRLGQRFLSLLS